MKHRHALGVKFEEVVVTAVRSEMRASRRGEIQPAFHFSTGDAGAAEFLQPVRIVAIHQVIGIPLAIVENFVLAVRHADGRHRTFGCAPRRELFYINVLVCVKNPDGPPGMCCLAIKTLPRFAIVFGGFSECRNPQTAILCLHNKIRKQTIEVINRNVVPVFFIADAVKHQREPGAALSKAASIQTSVSPPCTVPPLTWKQGQR